MYEKPYKGRDIAFLRDIEGLINKAGPSLATREVLEVITAHFSPGEIDSAVYKRFRQYRYGVGLLKSQYRKMGVKFNGFKR